MSSSRDYDIVIAGMGPVGLASAFEAAKKGKSVLLLEKRSEKDASLRPQAVVLNPQSKDQLLHMIDQNEVLDKDDIKFIDIITNSAEVKISDVQKFILKRIKYLNTLHKNGFKSIVEINYETNLNSVNLNVGSAITNKGKNINFGHLVVADGARSAEDGTLKLVNESLTNSNKKPIKHNTPSNMKHMEETYHLGAYIRLSRKDGNELKIPEREFASSFLDNKVKEKSKTSELYFLRFDKKSHEKNDKKSVKLGFIGEVPKEIFDKYEGYRKKIAENQALIKKCDEEIEKLQKNPGAYSKEVKENRQSNAEDQKLIFNNIIRTCNKERKMLVKTYVAKAAAQYLEVGVDDLNVEIKKSKKTPGKDRLKHLAFKGVSKQADKAALEVDGHCVCLVGDAYFTPNYVAGHGLNDGLSASKKIGDLPFDKKTSMTNFIGEYNNLTRDNAIKAQKAAQPVRWFRKLGRRARVHLTNFLESLVATTENKNKIDLKTELQTALSKDDIIQKFIKELFNFNDIITNKNRTYDTGYMSFADTPTINQLEDISKINGEIPLLIQITKEGKKAYQFYGKNEKGTWELQDLKIELIASLIKKLNIKFEENLSVLSKDDPNIKFLFGAKIKSDSGLDSSPLHFLPPDLSKLKNKIEEWSDFLKNNPTIVKQYREEISNHLAKIKSEIDQCKDEKVILAFNEVYDTYITKIDKHNSHLINLATNNLNKKDEAGHAPLYYAIQSANLNTIKIILDLGADYDKCDKNQNNVFSLGNARSNLEIANELFRRGANPFKGGTASPFYSALTSQDTKEHKFVLACLQAANDKTNPLHKMAKNELSAKMISKALDNQLIKNDTTVIKMLSEMQKNKSFTSILAGNSLFSHKKPVGPSIQDAADDNKKKVQFKT